MNRIKVLISAYACSPYRGSEPGMGWNFIMAISDYCDVHVITEEIEFRQDIEKYLIENPKYKKIKFHYIICKHNERLRNIWPPSYYWYYGKWQKHAFKLANDLDRKEDFDIIHQLNMVGFREPGYLWKIAKPFVWGPIGGLENSPWSFVRSLGLKGMIFYSCRNIINSVQRNYLKRPLKAAKRNNNFIISATSGTKRYIQQLWGVESKIISEVGLTEWEHVSRNIRKNEPIKIVWSGLHTSGKNLPLLLKALALISIPYELHILGDGIENKKWKNMARKLGIYNRCVWYGWINREDSLNTMKEGHVFCITSISDLTSTVLLEAISLGLPVITLDHCGFKDVITSECGIKIKITNPTIACRAFANEIERLYKNEALRRRLAQGALKRASEYSWQKKAKLLHDIYQNLLKQQNSPCRASPFTY